MRILILLLALTALAVADPLVSLEGMGGNTPFGVGRSAVRIQPDGTFEYYRQEKDERQGRFGAPGNPKGFDGWYHVKMSAADLARLKKTLKETDYAAWSKQKPGVIPPSAADGADWTLTAGKHVLHLWQLEGSDKIPLVALVRELEGRYQKLTR